jgi:UDP-glucose 4-epimerase
MKEVVLLTGGTGYIGSHTAVELQNTGCTVVLLDDLSNSSADVVDRIEQITGVRPIFYEGDACRRDVVERVFSEQEITAVVHFAGYKAVGESVRIPLAYYRNNLDATLTLLEAMERHSVRRFVFSSSATVYGVDNPIPYTEGQPVGGCTSPYGWTKFMVEQMVRDVCAANPAFSAVLLRYFNPIGAHESGLLGERPNGIPNNLMPYLTQVAAGIRDHLSVYGNDYPTPDGTGVRDYIHVVDLAQGHAAALRYTADHTGAEEINLGTGRGTSVLELIAAFEAATGVSVPYQITGRRAGDIAEFYAATEKAASVLGWRAHKTLADMCRDAWRWQQNTL